MRVLVVEDEPYMADAIRDGLRLEAIATVPGVGYRIDLGPEAGENRG